MSPKVQPELKGRGPNVSANAYLRNAGTHSWFLGDRPRLNSSLLKFFGYTVCCLPNEYGDTEPNVLEPRIVILILGMYPTVSDHFMVETPTVRT
ncbi:hypothetical protein RvY_11776 [Ramazzottius varieornatus]|uniref:Uncharacterized protein n=1 Tax=Ramazzottius varieornatus TaxID=947166 RepID=A0A1D1VR21_RAMVA|nr:hypothetical protein RvY_11776 [Ramazzottius varieornatus]